MNKDNIKIALVSFQKDAEREPPMGLVYLATYLRDKIKIKNIKIFDSNFNNLNEDLRKFSPDIIGVGPMTINYSEAVEFSENYKKERNIPIVIGGVHISTLPVSLNSCFDIGVIGEGEETFSEIVDLYLKKRRFDIKDLKKIKSIIFRNKNKLIKTEKRPFIELDSLPFPDFNFVNKDYFREHEGAEGIVKKAFVLTSRSCPYNCKFCSTKQFWGVLRLHSPEYVARLIKYFIENYGSNYVQIMDDLFTMSVDRLKKIKRELENLHVLDKIKGMVCHSRANLMNDELCKVLKELKVNAVSFGFESGSERMLNWLKGGSVTVEMNRNAVKISKKYGFKVYGSLMYGSPGEKIEDIRETNKFIDFLIENKADNVWSFISTPFPSTIFWEIAVKKGKVSEDMDWDMLSHQNIDNPLLLDEEVDKEEFKKEFLIGRKKLQKIKIMFVIDFLRRNPFNATKFFITNPRYYSSRIFNKIFKQ